VIEFDRKRFSCPEICGRIGRETRGRVLAAVKELKYYPNLHARNLVRRGSRTMGIIASDIENPFPHGDPRHRDASV
jgi:DNA-binding LacI/PurR family transcriptional regulator